MKSMKASVCRLLFSTILAMLPCVGSISLHAQQTQIPTLQVCNLSSSGGAAWVWGNEGFNIASRVDARHSGSFKVSIYVWCDPISGYPAGNLEISSISMTDSAVQNNIIATTIDQLSIAGNDTPTAWLSGRCTIEDNSASGQPPVGCRYWMMLANNLNQNVEPDSPPARDVVSFLVFDNTGRRIAYGTAPATAGSPSLFITPGP